MPPVPATQPMFTLAQLQGILADPKHPMHVTAKVVLQQTKAFPVAVSKALPVLSASKYTVQDLSRYLMQPSRLYDKLPWGAAGVGSAQYTFFQRASGSTGVTAEDTNLSQQANIGQNNAFVVTSIGFQFVSGIRPIITGAAGTIAAANRVNDINDVMQRGVAQFTVNGVGQFFNVGIGPLMACPANQYLESDGGVACGTATDMIMGTMKITGDGPSFLETPITLVGGASFSVTASFPTGAITLQSANATSFLSCYLDGFALRPAG